MTAHPARLPARDNPLRRTSDRIQWWLTRALLVITAVGLPAATVSTDLLTYHSQLQVVQTQSATRHTVAARLVADTAVPDAVSAQSTARVPATVTWTAPDGTVRTATVTVPPGEKAGSTAPVWVDSNGALTTAPVTRGQAVVTGWVAAGAAAGTVSVLSLTVWKGGTRLLDRRRYARWDQEWDQVEPRWSRRLPN
ncbi:MULTISPECIES: hypothetical protein [unclassified Kitasatospora]|uniref:Rv1733c family protein n=1 Tax=unclassified Kitasatospora TaxID=2633591 RepID=UPI0033DB680E